MQHHQPDWVLNAGAHTAINKGESDADSAYSVNAGPPEAIVSALAEGGGRMPQLSTDFVFNGGQGSPYSVEQARKPQASLAHRKLQEKRLCKGDLALKGLGFVLHSSGVMGLVGNNFALTMLRLHRERDELAVIADQVGCPSSPLDRPGLLVSNQHQHPKR